LGTQSPKIYLFGFDEYMGNGRVSVAILELGLRSSNAAFMHKIRANHQQIFMCNVGCVRVCAFLCVLWALGLTNKDYNDNDYNVTVMLLPVLCQ